MRIFLIFLFAVSICSPAFAETPSVTTKTTVVATKSLVAAPAVAKAVVQTAPMPVQPASAPAVTVTSVTTPVATVPYTQEWWQALIKSLVDIVTALIGLMVLGLIKALKTKFNLQVDTSKLDAIAEFALGWVEQKIVRAAKLDGKPTPAAEAISKAVDLAMQQAKEKGLDDKAREWWTAFLESKMGAGGTPAGDPPAPAKL